VISRYLRPRRRTDFRYATGNRRQPADGGLAAGGDARGRSDRGVSRGRHDEAFRIPVCLLKGTPQADQADLADQAAAVGKIIADFTVGRLDTDLTDAFGDKDVITLT
jgi:hypothetical protein